MGLSEIAVVAIARAESTVLPVLDNIPILESVYGESLFNTLKPRQNGRRFADDTFKRIFLNENVRISIKISLKFVPN